MLNSPRRLLVVEDNKDLCDALCELFSLRGVDVVSAADGIEAIQHLKSSRFDVVVSDIQMPRLNGIELLKVIKTDWPLTRVFLMTGNEDVLSKYRDQLASAEFVFLKGGDHEELFSKIDAAPRTYAAHS